MRAFSFGLSERKTASTSTGSSGSSCSPHCIAWRSRHRRVGRHDGRDHRGRATSARTCSACWWSPICHRRRSIHNANASTSSVSVTRCGRATRSCSAQRGPGTSTLRLADRPLFAYEATDPAGDNGAIVEASGPGSSLDDCSPSRTALFQLLPSSGPMIARHWCACRRDFADDVERARRNRPSRRPAALRPGSGHAFEWDQEGLRLIGEAQFKLRAYAGPGNVRDFFARRPPDDRAQITARDNLQRFAFAEPAGRREDF